MAENSGSHAALMDKVYRRQRHFYDLTRKYYLLGRDRMIGELELAPGERLVEVGCGTARNLINIARRYPEAELFGLDASSEMLRTARDHVNHAGLGGRIRLVQGYAEALDPAVFGLALPLDRVLFSYSLSMIPQWREALNAAARALAPGGRLHVVDFGDLRGLGSVGAFLMRQWLKLFHVEPRVGIVRALEADSRLCRPGNDRFTILPARYAFLWTTDRAGATRVGQSHVAAQTQDAGNSP